MSFEWSCRGDSAEGRNGSIRSEDGLHRRALVRTAVIRTVAVSRNRLGETNLAVIERGTDVPHSTTHPQGTQIMTTLSGKAALVTGASRGIGRASALALAKAGAQGWISSSPNLQGPRDRGLHG